MNFEKKILFGFALAVVILILLGAYSIKNNQEYVVTSNMVTQTIEVLYNIERTLVDMLDIVVGQRGFELTGIETFLEPYNSGISVVYGHLDKTRRLTKDNERQQKKLDTLEKLIKRRVQFAKERVDTKKKMILNEKNPKYNTAEDNKSLLVERIDAKSGMDQIRSVIRRIQDEEKRLLAERIKANEKQITEFNLTFNALLLFTVILLAMVFIIIRVNLKARKLSEEKVKSTQVLLQSSIESQKEVLILSIDRAYRYLVFNTAHKEGTMHAYGTAAAIGMNLLDSITNHDDRRKAKANFDRALAGEGHVTVQEFGDIERYYFETRYNPIINDRNEIIGATAFATNMTDRKRAEEHLQKVTEDLGVSNKELDAFCYSVSHDLRAPLRSINGYSRILLEDYADRLDQEGRHVLDTVMKNASKMGKLIDDLLDFSRIGKAGLNRTTLEMENLAKEIATEQLSGKGNKITVDILPLKQSVGDPSMIKLVWANLVSNAIKYSSKKDHPKIEIGSRRENGSIVYYVKDNGVGFDMHYVHKLFGVFQRLHRAEDFEGTGVGLAIVNRIISRHGGKVWAESKPNEGAIFYFSLPAKT